MHRFYHSKSININERIVMEEFSSHHAIKVMRLKNKDHLILFNGDGNDYEGQIVNINKKKIEIIINSKKKIDCESHLKIILLQAITLNEKMDLIIQKTTELGIQEIQPIICKRSIVKIKHDKIDKRLLHWEQVAISACEQCGRAKIPKIYKPENMEKYLKKTTALDNALKIILSPVAKKTLNEISYTKSQEIKVLIGPEGDFTKSELEIAIKKNYIPIKIGPRILRTETAPLSILSILQYKYGDIV